MKYLILLSIFLIPFASAIQFSPTSLEFNLEKNQISCKHINFQIESTNTLKDAWAQSTSLPWTITSFQTGSQELSLALSYPTEINPEEKEIQLCLSGAVPGEYHGALIFREDEIGNSVVQFAIWLKVNINKETGEPKNESSGQSTSKKPKHSSSSGSYRGSNSVIISGTNKDESEKKFQEINFDIPQEKIKLDSKAKKEVKTQTTPALLFIIPIILILLLLLFIPKRKRIPY